MRIADGMSTIVFRYSLKLPVFRMDAWAKYCSTDCLRSAKKTALELLNETLATLLNTTLLNQNEYGSA